MGEERWADLGRIFKAHPDLRACVIGTGRHGSGWIAKTLSMNGIECGHESVFGYTGDRRKLMAESSWLAAPYADRLRSAGVAIFHQVRHPENTLRSMLGGQMFGPGRKTKWYQFRKKHVEMSGDDMIDAMRIYVQWNEMCEKVAHYGWKIELFGPDEFQWICNKIGHWPPWTGAAPAGVNAHRKLEGFTLDDLPRGKEYDQLMTMGSRYGYL